MRPVPSAGVTSLQREGWAGGDTGAGAWTGRRALNGRKRSKSALVRVQPKSNTQATDVHK